MPEAVVSSHTLVVRVLHVGVFVTGGTVRQGLLAVRVIHTGVVMCVVNRIL